MTDRQKWIPELGTTVRIPELGTKVRVRFLNRYWVDGVVVSYEKEVDGMPQALVELDPDALEDWDLMVEFDGPLELVSPLQLPRSVDELWIRSSA